MGRYDANDAEVGFFNELMGGKSIVKKAVDLQPETADILGVQTVSPSILKTLESQATEGADEQKQLLPESGVPEKEAPVLAPEAADEDAEAQPEELQAPEESEDIGSAEHFDAEPEPDDEPAAEPDLPSRGTHGKLFTNKRAHPLQLLDVLSMRYGEAWPEWEPDTLWWALRRDFGSVGELTRNKILALDVAVSTDTPWLDWDTFENCGLAWNDIIPSFGAFQPLSPMQIAFTVHILRGVRPDEEFGHEVNAYIAAILDEYGWAHAPEEWFAGAQALLDRKGWLVGFQSDVASGWERIKDIAPEEIDWGKDDALSIHLLKMAVTKSYIDSRSELREQIPGAPSTSVPTSPPVP